VLLAGSDGSVGPRPLHRPHATAPALAPQVTAERLVEAGLMIAQAQQAEAQASMDAGGLTREEAKAFVAQAMG
jgi:hypothetical protein